MDIALEISDLRLQLKQPNIDVLSIMPRISALGQRAAELVPDLVAAIHRGTPFPLFWLVESIIVPFKNSELLVCLLKQHGENCFWIPHKCELLKAGFVWEFQKDLLNELYNCFEEHVSQCWRDVIIEALLVAGTSSSVETLKVIEYRMSKRIEKYSSELTSESTEVKFLRFTGKNGERDKPVSLAWEQEFLHKVQQAIEILGSRPDPEQIRPELAIQRLRDSENSNQEFKSSLRWDLKQNKINPALEMAVLKTLAAFGNCSGGTLWIGVDDAGKALGLQNDYSSLNAGKDKFERHLRGRISDLIGAAFGVTNVDVDFPHEQNVEICRVAVRPSPVPLFVKDGQNEVFYVRDGNRSVPLQGEDMMRHCDQRFPKTT